MSILGREQEAVKNQQWVVFTILALLMVGIAVANALLPSNVAVPVAYTLPISLAAWLRSRRWLWRLTIFAVVDANLGPLWGAGPSIDLSEVREVLLINRMLISAVLVGMAINIHLRIAADRQLSRTRGEIVQQGVELEAINEELRQREEENVRQNEELQSQTEELERQTEELRITNEELVEREGTMEQLLELSRSLTAELSKSEVLDKVCETLGALMDGNAAAIVERRGGELKIICHHGFGPAGPAHTVMPAADSFSSVIMSMGQTGFLEDTRLRPELTFPAPAEGEAFRSMVATPLRVQGRSVGTVELYSWQPRAWNALEVSLVESLAAQLSISLQNLELVETIRQERRRFEAAFRTVPFGMAVTDDASGDDVQINPAAAALFSLPLGENISSTTPIGAKLRRAVSRNRQPLPDEELPLNRALRGEEVLSEELDFVLGKGSVSVLCCAAPIVDGGGRITGAVSSYADITPLKTLQRELELRRREAEEANVRKTRFLAAVSHDIRTPANAISLMAELIKRCTDNPELAVELPELAGQLQANTHSLMELVGDVLDIARFDSGKVELLESEFSLGDLIAEEVRQVRPLADDKKIELIADPLERPIWLHTDRVKLGRVLGNLLGNAIKFTARGSVRIAATLAPQPDGRVTIRVTDTGIGIPAGSLTQIFDEFAQLHNPERDRNKGTGLGLAICKRLVSVMGGEISAESQPGEGSIFQVTLAATCVAIRLGGTLGVSSPPSRAIDQPTRLTQPLNLRILLVEDHTSTRDGTARILRQEGATIDEATNGQDALDRLKSSPPDIMLLDMMLPDMDGREILREVRENRPQGLRGVVVLTGDLTPERMQEVQQLGADSVIGKPIDLPKLLAVLEGYRRK